VTKTLELQPILAADADDLAELLDEPVSRQWLRSSTVAELRERFRRWESRRSPDGSEEWLNWVARRRDDGRAVVWVQATVRGDAAEIAYATVRSERGRGCAAEAVGAALDCLRRRGVRTISAHIAPDNAASAALAAALGFGPTDAVADGEVVWRLDPAGPGRG
jgi:RimJ/RimL family protein N-acetyltransferase